MVTGTISLVALLAFSFESEAIRALIFIVEYGAYLVLVVYLLTVIAALVLVWQRGHRPVPLATLTVGVAVLAYVLRDTFTPLPAGRCVSVRRHRRAGQRGDRGRDRARAGGP